MSKPINHGKKWSYKEENDVIIAIREGSSIEQIAKKHKRTLKAINIRISQILWRSVVNIMAIEKVRNITGYAKDIMEKIDKEDDNVDKYDEAKNEKEFGYMRDFDKIFNIESVVEENQKILNEILMKLYGFETK